jgi:hypothetical protein
MNQWTLRTIVEQLESCGFKDEIGHSLHRNEAFIALKQMSESEEDEVERARRLMAMDAHCESCGKRKPIYSLGLCYGCYKDR